MTPRYRCLRYSYGHGSVKMSLVQLSEALGWATTAVVKELRRCGEIDDDSCGFSFRFVTFHVVLCRVCCVVLCCEL